MNSHLALCIFTVFILMMISLVIIGICIACPPMIAVFVISFVGGWLLYRYDNAQP